MSRVELLKLSFQRFVGRLTLVPFGGLLIFLMRNLRGYRIENVEEIRRDFRRLLEDDRPLILCSNHLTFIDSALMIWAFAPNWWYVLNFRYFPWNLPAGDFFKKKLVYRLIAYLTKCIFIHRDGSKEHKNGILDVCRHLALRGELVSIFPEGRRSRTGKFDPERITFGVGKIIAGVPDCRVLCLYLRGDKQATFSNYPEKGSTFQMEMKCIEPRTEKTGREGYAEIVAQIASTIKGLEEKYMASRRVPMPRKETALITGASSGIGRALAYRLADSGCDLVLVSRDEERLGQIAKECREKYGSTVTVIGHDLSHEDAGLKVFQALNDRKVSVDILVNNAGFGVHGDFLETDLSLETALVKTQILSFLALTKLCLPSMIRAKRGSILNVASVYAYAPVPQQSVYAACKAFLLSFSESLAAEVRPHGITVTVVCPGVTRTEFRSRAGIVEKKPGSGMSAEAVASFAYRSMRRGKRVATPGAINQAFVIAARHLPFSTLSGLMQWINYRRGVNQA